MAKARTDLIHCDNCGEDYAATYRRCPFCGAKPGQQLDDYDYDDDGAPRQGGKRLIGGGRGGDSAKIALCILAALVILAVVCILLSLVIPKLVAPPAQPTEAPTEEPTAVVTAAPSDEPTEAPTAATGEPAPSFHPLPTVEGMDTDDPLALDSPDLPPVESDPVSAASPAPSAPTTNTPAPSAPATSPAPSAPTTSGDLKLSSTDFTLSPRYPTYQMETGLGRALTTYSIADETVATVNSTGLITAVGNGNTTLTVTDQSGHTATAIVRVSGMSGQSAAPSAAPSQAPAASQAPASGDAALTAFGRTVDDFTINAQNPDPVTLKVQGGTAASWRSRDTGVATVSDGGKVTAVGNGTTKIECTLSDGSVLTCTVRVSGL